MEGKEKFCINLKWNQILTLNSVVIKKQSETSTIDSVDHFKCQIYTSSQVFSSLVILLFIVCVSAFNIQRSSRKWFLAALFRS